ncbi:hypothetical protein Ciccas_004001 [Cichlidogyrus casuarinus]|uniref:Uncharacterized protein n=1 Tax=Cichlidogyrus casuarinus TaxID=1844966 RepID=A0ABD2QCT9_9PLAT
MEEVQPMSKPGRNKVEKPISPMQTPQVVIQKVESEGIVKSSKLESTRVNSPDDNGVRKRVSTSKVLEPEKPKSPIQTPQIAMQKSESEQSAKSSKLENSTDDNGVRKRLSTSKVLEKEKPISPMQTTQVEREKMKSEEIVKSSKLEPSSVKSPDNNGVLERSTIESQISMEEEDDVAPLVPSQIFETDAILDLLDSN